MPARKKLIENNIFPDVFKDYVTSYFDFETVPETKQQYREGV